MRISRVVTWLLLVLASLRPLWAAARDARTWCSSGLTRCFHSGDSELGDSESDESLANPVEQVTLQVRKAMWGGPFAHKWVQVGMSDDAVTVGYGPANFPFVDAGQVLVVDKKGAELVSKWHLFHWHFTPAERPGAGRPIGKPILVSAAQAQSLVARERRHRLVPLYIPPFYDCHTFVCALTASAQGKSTVPCYLFFKGHW